jgi:hypothetical protein
MDFHPSRIPDPGSRGQKGTGSRIRIRIRNTAIFSNLFLFFRCEDNLEVKVELPSLSPDPEYSAPEDLPDADTDILGVKEEDLKGAYESEAPR